MTMHLSLEEEGNLVMYADQEQKVRLWETHTSKKGGVALHLNDHGALQVVDAFENVIWTDSMMPNDLWKGPAKSDLKQGEVLKAQQFLRSQNGRFVCLLKDNLEI